MREPLLFDIDPVSFGLAPGVARLIERLVAVPSEEDGLFDVFAADPNGDPVGECLGRAKINADSGMLESAQIES